MNQNLQDELTQTMALGFRALIEKSEAMVQEIRALRTIHERTSSCRVSEVVGEHGPELLRKAQDVAVVAGLNSGETLAAILEELRAIRGLLQSQDDEKAVFIFSNEEGAIKATTKGALRAEEAKWAKYSCSGCSELYEGKPPCGECPMPVGRRTTLLSQPSQA